MAAVDLFVQRVVTDDLWMRDAACRGLTQLFFPTQAERPQARERREAAARAVCSSCTALGRCREFARNQYQLYRALGESLNLIDKPL